MPPKAKFEKDEIINAAFKIVKTNGMTALTARSLGDALGSSPRPIFTVFNSMEEVQNEVIKMAKFVYSDYVEKGLNSLSAFKAVGTQYIVFALNEPKLFQLLFMSEQKNTLGISEVLPIIEEHYKEILSSICDGYKIEKDVAEKLYRHLWIYTHGIATLCATKTCMFTADEINMQLTEVFLRLIKKIKSE